METPGTPFRQKQKLCEASGDECQLGGGNSNIVFSTLPGEMIQFDEYFSNGLKPPTSQVCHFPLACLFVERQDSRVQPLGFKVHHVFEKT